MPDNRFDDWPVLPEGIEGVITLRMPKDYVPSPDTCFVCGKPMPDVESGEMCWGVPGRGVAHSDCYDRELADAG